MSDPAPKPEDPIRPLGRELTREDFTSVRMRQMVAEALKRDGMALMPEEAHRASLEAFRDSVPQGDGVWVLGYGSLMWNPAFHVSASAKAHCTGYHRRFCLTMSGGRGTPELPGLMLGIDGGGALTGVAHRIAPEAVESELAVLWNREMLTGAYDPAWVDLQIEGSGPARALAFVVNRAHPRYEGALDEDAQVRRIATAAGGLGSNRDYLYRTVEHMRALGVEDETLFRLEARVRAAAGDANNTEETAR